MITLMIDSCWQQYAVSLATGDQVFNRCLPIVHRGDDRTDIVSVAEGLLREHGLTFQDLQRIGCTHGPGQFTGIRSAVSLATASAYALDIPIALLSSLQCLAEYAYRHQGASIVHVGMDARRQEVYSGHYQLISGRMQPIEEDQLIPIEQFAWADGVTAIGDVTAEGRVPDITFCRHSDQYVDIMHSLTAEHAQKVSASSAEALSIHYVRNRVTD